MSIMKNFVRAYVLNAISINVEIATEKLKKIQIIEILISKFMKT